MVAANHEQMSVAYRGYIKRKIEPVISGENRAGPGSWALGVQSKRYAQRNVRID